MKKQSNKKQQLFTTPVGLTWYNNQCLSLVGQPIALLLRTSPEEVEHRLIVAAIHAAFAKVDKATVAEELLLEEEAKRLAAKTKQSPSAKYGWVGWTLRVGPYTSQRLARLERTHGAEALVDFVNWAVREHLAKAVHEDHILDVVGDAKRYAEEYTAKGHNAKAIVAIADPKDLEADDPVTNLSVLAATL